MLEFIYTILKERAKKFRYIPPKAINCAVTTSIRYKKYVQIAVKCRVKEDGKIKYKTKSIKPEEVEDAKIEVLVFRYLKKLEKPMTALKVLKSENVKEVAKRIICEFFREIFNLKKDEKTSLTTVPDAVELLRKIGFKEGEAKEVLLWLESIGCIKLHPASEIDPEMYNKGIEKPGRGVLYHISW